MNPGMEDRAVRNEKRQQAAAVKRGVALLPTGSELKIRKSPERPVTNLSTIAVSYVTAIAVTREEAQRAEPTRGGGTMEKTLRLLGLAAVIGACAIVMAQQNVFGPAKARDGQAQSGQGGTATANQAGHGFRNNLLVLMSQYFCSKQSYEIEKAEIAGLQDRVQPIIHATCAANLTLLTPEAQKREIAGWQLDVYAPGSQAWAKVASTRTLAKELLDIDPKLDAKMDKILDDIWAPVMEPENAFARQIGRASCRERV